MFYQNHQARTLQTNTTHRQNRLGTGAAFQVSEKTGQLKLAPMVTLRGVFPVLLVLLWRGCPQGSCSAAEDGEDLGPGPKPEDLEDEEDAAAITIHPSLRSLGTW